MLHLTICVLTTLRGTVEPLVFGTQRQQAFQSSLSSFATRVIRLRAICTNCDNLKAAYCLCQFGQGMGTWVTIVDHLAMVWKVTGE